MYTGTKQVLFVYTENAHQFPGIRNVLCVYTEKVRTNSRVQFTCTVLTRNKKRVPIHVYRNSYKMCIESALTPSSSHAQKMYKSV